MSKGLSSTQGGNEATGALQAGGDVEHTKLNSPGRARYGHVVNNEAPFIPSARRDMGIGNACALQCRPDHTP